MDVAVAVRPGWVRHSARRLALLHSAREGNDPAFPPRNIVSRAERRTSGACGAAGRCAYVTVFATASGASAASETTTVVPRPGSLPTSIVPS